MAEYLIPIAMVTGSIVGAFNNKNKIKQTCDATEAALKTYQKDEKNLYDVLQDIDKVTREQSQAITDTDLEIANLTESIQNCNKTNNVLNSTLLIIGIAALLIFIMILFLKYYLPYDMFSIKGLKKAWKNRGIKNENK